MSNPLLRVCTCVVHAFFQAAASVGVAKLVGWGRQLDAAAASPLPIVTTTFETEVQTISRKLKALGIVQLVNKGEGLEAWRQSKLEV